MCGILLMSSRPTFHPSTSSLISPRDSRHCRSSGTIGSVNLPATQAVNSLIMRNHLARDGFPEGRVWKRLVQEMEDASSFGSESVPTKNDNLHSTNTSTTRSFPNEEDGLCPNMDADPFQFPVIEWCDSEEEGDYSSVMDGSRQTTVSAPAILGGCYGESHPPRKANLVRSISLVSSIMKELNNSASALKKLRRAAPFKAHKKRRTKASRLVALSHPGSLAGLQATHHEGSGKYFL